MAVFTIGYEGVELSTFIAALKRHRIDRIVDVRELPLSRKKGFSKKALAIALNERGVDYVHMVDLGCPKAVRARYREDGNWRRYTTGFMKHLQSQQPAVDALAKLAAKSKCALMCFEADPNFCHRSFVANAVSAATGLPITHIEPDMIRTSRSADLPLLAAGADRRG